MSSTVKCVGAVAAAGAVVSGGVSLYRGLKARKHVIDSAEKISQANGGKIPTGGMTPDGKLWDGFTTVDKVKKDSKKTVALGTTFAAIVGAVVSGVISCATLFMKAHVK